MDSETVMCVSQPEDEEVDLIEMTRTEYRTIMYERRTKELVMSVDERRMRYLSGDSERDLSAVKEVVRNWGSEHWKSVSCAGPKISDRRWKEYF